MEELLLRGFDMKPLFESLPQIHSVVCISPLAPVYVSALSNAVFVNIINLYNI